MGPFQVSKIARCAKRASRDCCRSGCTNELFAETFLFSLSFALFPFVDISLPVCKRFLLDKSFIMRQDDNNHPQNTRSDHFSKKTLLVSAQTDHRPGCRLCELLLLELQNWCQIHHCKILLTHLPCS